MRMMTKMIVLFGLLLMAASAMAQTSGTVTYVYTDPQGTPLAEANASGTITATFDYTPYGNVTLGTAPDGPGYTGHVNDPDTNLIYMQARYYDPATGHFLSADPKGIEPGDALAFNRYDYASNNPIVNVDPNGQESASLTLQGVGAVQTDLGRVTQTQARVAISVESGILLSPVANEALGLIKTGVNIYKSGEAKSTTPSETQASTADTTQSNTNPYEGPVDSPVIVVDKDGNAIPVQSGEKITADPKGNYQQVRDANDNATGTRLDRGGHSNQPDPKARVPHAHRPGITDPKGNPHLPINTRTEPPPPPST